MAGLCPAISRSGRRAPEVGVIRAPIVVRHLGVVDYVRHLTVNSVIFVVTALTEGGLANVAL